jgi:hypothetical protein
MRFTAAFVSSLALVLGATAAPVANEYERPVATFSAWNTECGLDSGHTFGMTLVDRAWSGLCFPLPTYVRGLELLELTDGCASEQRPLSLRCCHWRHLSTTQLANPMEPQSRPLRAPCAMTTPTTDPRGTRQAASGAATGSSSRTG